ncbi:MAG: hypothetical protein RR248_05855, partial [Clostridia bacterium]
MTSINIIFILFGVILAINFLLWAIKRTNFFAKQDDVLNDDLADSTHKVSSVSRIPPPQVNNHSFNTFLVLSIVGLV